MRDFVFIAVTLLFFVGACGYTYICERIIQNRSDEEHFNESVDGGTDAGTTSQAA